MKYSSLRLNLFCVLAVAATSTFSFAQSSYSVTDLGSLSTHGYSVAMGVNAAGQVTGASGSTGTNNSDVFLYSDGSLTNLGTLGGTSGIGNAINRLGQVAGYSQNSAGTYRGFFTSGETLVDIGDLGGGSAVAYGINDKGQVIGSAVTASGDNHPFLYTNGRMTDLGTLGSPTGSGWWNAAQGVNNSGAVTGISYDVHGNFFGFVWKSGKMTKMGTLGGAWSLGTGINNKGQITGQAYTKNGSAHAFIATCATCSLKDLGTFAGSTSSLWGNAISDSGVVVGRSTFQNTYHAFVYNGARIKDLNSMIPAGSGWVLIEADGINASGQIVGMGTHNGQERGFLLTPQ
jgi:probable HAF family extracellular repeat protein